MDNNNNNDNFGEGIVGLMCIIGIIASVIVVIVSSCG